MNKVENLSGFQILAAVGCSDDKPLIRFQLQQKLLGFRQRLTHIEIAPCPGVIIVSELDTNRFAFRISLQTTKRHRRVSRNALMF